MNQTDFNFIQQAVYEKCDAILKTIVDNSNAATKKKETTTKKGETK